MFLNNLDICFQNPVSRNVEIYVQKKNIETCIHKAEVLFQGCKCSNEMKHTSESKLSRYHHQNTLNGYFSINITHLLYIQYTFKAVSPVYITKRLYECKLSTVRVAKNPTLNLKVHGH